MANPYEQLLSPLFEQNANGQARLTVGEGLEEPDPRWPFAVVGRVAFDGENVTITYGTRNSSGFIALSEHTETVVPTFPQEPDLLESAGLVNKAHIADCRYETDCPAIDFWPRAVMVRRGMLRAPHKPEEAWDRAVDEQILSMWQSLLGVEPAEDLLSPECRHAQLVADRFRGHMLYGDDPLWVAMGRVHPNLDLPPTTRQLYRVSPPAPAQGVIAP